MRLARVAGGELQQRPPELGRDRLVGAAPARRTAPERGLDGVEGGRRRLRVPEPPLAQAEVVQRLGAVAPGRVVAGQDADLAERVARALHVAKRVLDGALDEQRPWVEGSGAERRVGGGPGLGQLAEPEERLGLAHGGRRAGAGGGRGLVVLERAGVVAEVRLRVAPALERALGAGRALDRAAVELDRAVREPEAREVRVAEPAGSVGSRREGLGRRKVLRERRDEVLLVLARPIGVDQREQHVGRVARRRLLALGERELEQLDRAVPPLAVLLARLADLRHLGGDVLQLVDREVVGLRAPLATAGLDQLVGDRPAQVPHLVLPRRERGRLGLLDLDLARAIELLLRVGLAADVRERDREVGPDLGRAGRRLAAGEHPLEPRRRVVERGRVHLRLVDRPDVDEDLLASVDHPVVDVFRRLDVRGEAIGGDLGHARDLRRGVGFRVRGGRRARGRGREGRERAAVDPPRGEPDARHGRGHGEREDRSRRLRKPLGGQRVRVRHLLERVSLAAQLERRAGERLHGRLDRDRRVVALGREAQRRRRGPLRGRRARAERPGQPQDAEDVDEERALLAEELVEPRRREEGQQPERDVEEERAEEAGEDHSINSLPSRGRGRPTAGPARCRA